MASVVKIDFKAVAVLAAATDWASTEAVGRANRPATKLQPIPSSPGPSSWRLMAGPAAPAWPASQLTRDQGAHRFLAAGYALARGVRNSPYPEEDFIVWWEGLLDWTPHAVQWLFRQDWRQGELALLNVADAAMKQRASAVSELPTRVGER